MASVTFSFHSPPNEPKEVSLQNFSSIDFSEGFLISCVFFKLWTVKIENHKIKILATLKEITYSNFTDFFNASFNFFKNVDKILGNSMPNFLKFYLKFPPISSQLAHILRIKTQLRIFHKFPGISLNFPKIIPLWKITNMILSIFQKIFPTLLKVISKFFFNNNLQMFGKCLRNFRWITRKY